MTDTEFTLGTGIDYSIFKDDVENAVHIEIQPKWYWEADELYDLINHLTEIANDLVEDSDEYHDTWTLTSDDGSTAIWSDGFFIIDTPNLDHLSADIGEFEVLTFDCLSKDLENYLKWLGEEAEKDLIELSDCAKGSADVGSNSKPTYFEYMPRFNKGDEVLFKHGERYFLGDIFEFYDHDAHWDQYVVASNGYNFVKNERDIQLVKKADEIDIAGAGPFAGLDGADNRIELLENRLDLLADNVSVQLSLIAQAISNIETAGKRGTISIY